ncbi:bifunctional DNA primase/polymerase [Microbacterium sp. AK031]|uniref:bifunctional DNA primase/polymerase n=1 Tax=Microbacterium sp. AK031 TaxID=2723076 RepID=UPI00216A04C4|nr:bifunctional DNA primase/polymerase [Microbacterium sp. AK031]
MQRHALELAEAGWSVLPLNGKKPTTGLTPHGVHDATISRKRIREWWAEHDWNIGCPVPNNVVVFDIDPRNGGSRRALEQVAGAPLAPTLTTRSGSGGWHLYYVRPWEHVSGLKLPSGIDFKTNGYLVMPPSTHPDTGQPYKWNRRPIAHMSFELARLVLEMPRERHERDGTYDISGLVAWVRTLPQGERHDGVHWAARRVHEGRGGTRHIERLIEAAEDIGFAPFEARRVVESVQKGPRK